MKVNPSKTQLLCVSGAINYETKSYVNLGNDTIRSSDTMKILGLTLDSKCTMAAHVANLKRKFAARIWIIRHLKRASLEAQKLIRVYCSLIRSCLEYAGATFHSLLTQTQSMMLERLQAIALRTVFGWGVSYRECLRCSGLQSLAERRFNACKSFATKAANNVRFAKWFPENHESTYQLRRRDRFRMDFARHERLRKAPLYYMRRLLNELERHEDLDFCDLDG